MFTIFILWSAYIFLFKKKRITQKIPDIFHMEQKALENKIIILQTDLILKARKFEEYFWKYVNREKYANINKNVIGRSQHIFKIMLATHDLLDFIINLTLDPYKFGHWSKIAPVRMKYITTANIFDRLPFVSVSECLRIHW